VTGRILGSVLALLCLASAAPAQSKASRGFHLAPDGAVRIYNLVGSTEIEGWDRDSVAISATIPPGGGQLFAGGSGRAAKLGIESQDPNLSGPGSILVVRLPRAARVWVKTASARITASGLRGEVEVTSITGDLLLTGEPRVVTIESIEGRVEIRGPATLTRIKAGAGNVRLSGIRGEFTVSTVQGGVTVETEEILSGRIETVSGPVEVTGALPPSARFEIVTHDGDAKIHIGPPIDARFDLSTIHGKIVTRMFDQPDKIYAERTALFWFGPSAGTERGATVTVRSFKGNIRVDSNPK
jgi:hypothetical protein